MKVEAFSMAVLLSESSLFRRGWGGGEPHKLVGDSFGKGSKGSAAVWETEKQEGCVVHNGILSRLDTVSDANRVTKKAISFLGAQRDKIDKQSQDFP